MRLTHSSGSSRSENFGACSLPLPVLHPWLWPWRRSLRDWSPQRLSWAFQLLCCHLLWSFPQRSLWRLPRPLPEVVEPGARGWGPRRDLCCGPSLELLRSLALAGPRVHLLIPVSPLAFAGCCVHGCRLRRGAAGARAGGFSQPAKAPSEAWAPSASGPGANGRRASETASMPGGTPIMLRISLIWSLAETISCCCCSFSASSSDRGTEDRHAEAPACGQAR